MTARDTATPRPPATLPACLQQHAKAEPLRPAFADDAVTLSYVEIERRVRAVASSLALLGVGKGDVVAAQLPNGIEFMLTYLAAGRVGAVLQTIHMPYRAAEVEPLLRHARAKVFVCVGSAKDFGPARFALAAQSRLPELRTVIAVGPEAPAQAIPFAALEAGSEQDRGSPGSADDPFLLLYTSGTTSSPKGVRVSPAKFLVNAGRTAAELGIDGSWVLLSAAPFTHLYGLMSVNAALATGACTAALPAFTPAAFAEALDRHRPRGVFLAPAHIAACLKEGLLTPERLSSLAFAMVSGSTCPPELARALQDLMPGGKVCQLWGMSELQVGAFTRPGDSVEVRLGTTGRASPGTELRVAGDDGPLPAGSEGELQARGASVFDGYLDNGQGTAAAFTPDGWFRTGDLALIDTDGNVRITGRLKDIINRGGVKFNPVEVEAVIERHPAVESCAIVPMPDPLLGEKACCFVVPTHGAQLNLETLRAWLAQHEVAKTRWPERLEFIDAMPLTPTRKIKKAELAMRAAAGR